MKRRPQPECVTACKICRSVENFSFPKVFDSCRLILKVPEEMNGNNQNMSLVVMAAIKRSPCSYNKNFLVSSNFLMSATLEQAPQQTTSK